MNPKLKLKYQFLLVLFIYYLPISAAENFFSGSRMSALSNCGVSISDVWSVSHNQAGIAFLEKTIIACNHQQVFLMKELGVSNLAVVIPSKRSAWGFHSSYFGYSKYHEIKAALAYALKINPNISTSLNFDYFRSSIPSVGAVEQKFCFELGIMAHVLEKLTLGAHVFNPVPNKWKINEQPDLPLLARMGASLTIETKCIIHSEVQFSTQQKIIPRLALEYYPLNSLALRLGISGGQYLYSFGMGYNYSRFRIDISFIRHEILGTSPSIDLIYAW
jgi:hypothetical protein